MNEIEELKLEIDRHHRDFKKISVILDKAFESYPILGMGGNDNSRQYTEALKQIRNIVG